MKTRLVTIALLLLMLAVLLSQKDERISNMLLATINPIKQSYQNFTQDLEDKSHSYIFQKESIEKLGHENRILRKRLLEQMHYIKQVKNIHEILPDLSYFPVSSVAIVETISYVRLNSFSQIILTKPEKLLENKLYGLVQNRVVAGVSEVHNGQLYGYLTSDKKCRFSVFIGKNKAPGIALGLSENEMLIKFIPKWHKIKVGEQVLTSGLDNIFFAGIPVGVVTAIDVQSAYSIAHIKTHSDIFHPKTFFLISDAETTLLNDFNNSTIAYESMENTKKRQDYNTSSGHNKSINMVSSIPKQIDQTQEDVIEPESPNESQEVQEKKKIKVKKLNTSNNTLDSF